jgi:autotransporter-associated beta strand protein
VVGFACLQFIAATAQAQSTWDGGGGDNNWSTAANWDNNQVPTFPTPLVIAGSTRPAPNNDLTNPSVDGITFNAGAAAFTVGGNAFTLGDEAAGDYRRGGITQLDDSLQTISNNITIARGLHDITTVNGAGGLTLAGTISRNRGLGVRFAALGGPINTTLTNTNGIIGGWATSENRNPALMAETLLWSKVDANGNVVPYLDYTAADDIDGFNGETTLPAGVNSASNIRWFGGADLSLTADTDMNTLLYDGEGLSVFNLAGFRLRITDGGGIFRSNPIGEQNVESLRFSGGTLTAGNTSAPATLYIWKNTTITDPALGTPNGEEDNFTIHLESTAITDNPQGGPVTVVANGSGGVRSSAAGHSFTGGLYLNRGVWRAQTNVETAFGAGPVYVASGAQFYVNADGVVPNDVFVVGNGIEEGPFFVGAARVAADGAVLSGTWTLTGDTRLGTRGAQASNAEFGDPALQGAMWTGRITGDYNLELNIRNDQGGATLDGQLPTMIFTNSANDWGGDTTIGNGRFRVGGTGEVIPHGPGKGDLILLGEGSAAARPTVVTLDNHTETVNGLFSEGALSEIFITNQTEGQGTLRVGANDATSTFGGTITDYVDPTLGFTGTVAVSKIGAGTLSLTGMNAYTGDTRVDAGTLSINSAFLADTADVSVAAGGLLNLDFSGTDTIDSLFLGGVPRAPGVWGAVGSGAANSSPLLTGTGRLMVTTLGTAPSLTGDYNGNGVVDAADYVTWRQNLDQAVTLPNDSSPGTVTQADYTVWRTNFGRTAGGGAAVAASVPEPATWLLLTICGIFIFQPHSRMSRS